MIASFEFEFRWAVELEEVPWEAAKKEEYEVATGAAVIELREIVRMSESRKFTMTVAEGRYKATSLSESKITSLGFEMPNEERSEEEVDHFGVVMEHSV